MKKVVVSAAVVLLIAGLFIPGVFVVHRLHAQPRMPVRYLAPVRHAVVWNVQHDVTPVMPLVVRAGAVRALNGRTAAIGDQLRLVRDQDFNAYRAYRPIFRLWQDYSLAADDEVREVVVISGNATIAGHVGGDLVVWLGDVKLESTAVVDGSLILVAGNLHVADGASVRHELALFGGAIDAPQTFSPGGDHFVAGTPAMGEDLRAIVPWVTRGLLWGRLIVPSIGWVWVVVFIVLIVSVVLNHVFDRSIGTTASVVVTRPLSVFMTGLVVLLVMGPLLVILAASVVGLLVVPFLACAMFIAWTVGKIAVVRGLGMRVLPEGEPDSRLLSARSFVVGFVIIAAAYAVPVLGLVTWALISVFGLGAAGMTVVATIRREYPAKPKVPKPPKAARAVTDAMPARVMASDVVYQSSMASTPVPAPIAASFVQEPAFAGHPAAAAVAPDVPPFDPAPGASGLAAFPRASFLDRAAAFGLDCLLVAIVDRLLGWSRADGAYFVLLFAYHVAFWALKGTTLGGIICRLRVVRTNGEALRGTDAVVRGLASLFSIALLGIGCFWMLQDPQSQTWHDKIANTLVVKVPKDFALP